MTIADFGQQVLISLLTTFFYGLGLPLFFSWVLTIINRNSKQVLASHFGINSQVYLGALGIIIHESSHLLMALLFAHKITGVRLIKFAHPQQAPDDPEALTLGYVNHRWNSGSTYQTMGNFFIGFAPIVGVSVLIFGLTAWLLPTVSANWLAFAVNPQVGTLFHAPVTNIPIGAAMIHILVWLVFVTNLSVGGFDLSSADLRNSSTGLATYTLLLGLIGLSAGLLQWPVATWAQHHLLPIYLALSVVVAISGVVNIAIHWITKTKF
ncbi:hypothetical protein [Furfurilactobacillus curtus]|uniref:Integral membrane protein n=1 Tax=Furfurilactobacillus curtus TaxID=1746200 RepID=A0ABQ5JPX8_9LACO